MYCPYLLPPGLFLSRVWFYGHLTKSIIILGFSLVLIKHLIHGRVNTVTQRHQKFVFADYKQTNAFLCTWSKFLRRAPRNVLTVSRPCTNWLRNKLNDSQTVLNVFVSGWTGRFGMREHCLVSVTGDGINLQQHNHIFMLTSLFLFKKTTINLIKVLYLL